MNNTAKQPFDWSQLLHNKAPLVELFLGGIRECYWSENQLVRTMTMLTNAASSRDLQHLFYQHLEHTKIHVDKLERVFELMDEIIEARRSAAVAGLAIEAKEAIEYTDEGTATRDLAIILVCQKIEQYEMTTYGGMIKIAVALGRGDIADLLAEIMDDEIACNELLLNQSEIVPRKAIEEI